MLISNQLLVDSVSNDPHCPVSLKKSNVLIVLILLWFITSKFVVVAGFDELMKGKKRFGGHNFTGKVRCSKEEEFVSCYKMVFSEGTAFFKRVTEGSEAVSGSIILGNIVFNL